MALLPGIRAPRFEPVHGPDGAIVDVRIVYPLDLTTQMLEYSRRRFVPPPGEGSGPTGRTPVPSRQEEADIRR